MTAADRSCLCTLRQALDWCDELDPDGEFGLGVAVDVYHVWVGSGARQSDPACRKTHPRVSCFRLVSTDHRSGQMTGECREMASSIFRQFVGWLKTPGFNGAIELEIFSPYWWQKDINSTLDISVDRIAHYC
ncbi:endonuclease [Escherichia coli]|uniref:Endonuclease n=1 Tax=Escherichia coli TaxID=562 RepID=A0A484YE22_ECOLX|nr:endonuclease [Escherichia coli]